MTLLGCEIYESIALVPVEVWNSARSATPSCFTDSAFVRAVERSFPAHTRVFHAIVKDDSGRPEACASLFLMSVDLLLLAGPHFQHRAGWLRRLLPRFGTLKVLFCGLPVSAGQSQIGFAQGANRPRAIEKLDHLLRVLARREQARAIVFKEFGAHETQDLDRLLSRGYLRAESPPTYELTRSFSGFPVYCSNLKSHYRNDVRRSQKKFERAGCRVVHLDNPENIQGAYTPEAHRLYEAVVAKSEVKLELLPHQFFHELTKQCGDRVSLTAIYRGDRLVAFNWGLWAAPTYHFLFCGLDYTQNAEADLYFNLMYQQLDYAFKRGAKIIRFGQTADTFKTRVGGTGRSLCFYVRSENPFFSWIMNHASGYLFPPRPSLRTHDVFKVGPQ